MLEVRGLAKSIRSGSRVVEILRGIDISISPGTFAVIQGPSGSGKSTLLGLLAGLDKPTEGEVLLDGKPLTALPEDEMALLRGRKIGFVFQAYQLVPTLTALENVMLPLDLTGHADRESRERAIGLLGEVGLADRTEHYPVQLSGGEQQRVALARAFVTNPPIVLADEPTGNLDSRNGAMVLEVLLKLNRERGTTLVMVTHDDQIASKAARRIALIDGRIVSDVAARSPAAAAPAWS
ncbi:MAG: ABC transporter ATP-binding protein [Bryobacterales bacterium]|nr:ABC transporter ATP-binding protein [Bryobacterales bacterium]MDE0627877.1 ABC transporter ATP-binding protein [Bryobacterales bacterium]